MAAREARSVESTSAVAVDSAPIRLTELVSCGGCAAKYPAALLESLVGGLAPGADPDLLVGLSPTDDAAVYRLDDERALVFTVDFFPPLVDDPADFGSIAAANALNDVFAMGGRPLLALSVAAFPESLPAEAVAAVVGAAAAKVAEAGGVLAGGHTLRDDEPAFGLAVAGLVRPDEVWTKAGARAGDDLYLTKALGTGLLVQARRELAAAVASMVSLNAEAAEAIRPFGPHAVTDVTGFGLAGHAYELATRSGVAIELDAGALPALPGALELAAEGVRTGGDRRNRAFVGDAFSAHGATEAQVALAFDPQTSGGLLVAIAPGALDGLAARVGRVAEGGGVRLVA
jgi:selenide, water dikinase